MFLTGSALQCVGPLALRDFCKIFLPNISKDHKQKSYPLRAGSSILLLSTKTNTQIANSANITRQDLARREEAKDQNKNVA